MALADLQNRDHSGGWVGQRTRPPGKEGVARLLGKGACVWWGRGGSGAPELGARTMCGRDLWGGPRLEDGIC